MWYPHLKCKGPRSDGGPLEKISFLGKIFRFHFPEGSENIFFLEWVPTLWRAKKIKSRLQNLCGVQAVLHDSFLKMSEKNISLFFALRGFIDVGSVTVKVCTEMCHCTKCTLTRIEGWRYVLNLMKEEKFNNDDHLQSARNSFFDFLEESTPRCEDVERKDRLIEEAIERMSITINHVHERDEGLDGEAYGGESIRKEKSLPPIPQGPREKYLSFLYKDQRLKEGIKEVTQILSDLREGLRRMK